MEQLVEDLLTKQYEVQVTEDVQYGSGIVDFGTQPRERALMLDIYRPVGAAVQARPAIVLGFGGAFHRGSKRVDTVVENGHQNTPISEYCYEFARRGYICFSIEYRLTPEDPDPGSTPVLLNPMNINRDRIDYVRGIMGLTPSTPTMIANAIEAAIDDMAAAITWVHAHADEFGVDSTRVAAGGFSAGAMTALAATYGQRTPSAAVIAISGGMGIAEMRSYIKSAGDPPALLIRGERDLPGISVLNQALAAHMQTVGVDHECYVVPDGTHFYKRSEHLFDVHGEKRTVEGAIASFLSRVLAIRIHVD